MQVSGSIKTIRQKALLTQAEFAKILGVSTSTVIRWESDKVLPNLNAMKAIKQFCNNNGLPYDRVESCWLEARTEVKK